MKPISRDTDYAVRALAFIAKATKKDSETIVTVGEIVDQLNLPERFLRRILQRLAREKILSSYKGKEGGFCFLKSPSNVRLTDVIEVFQGKSDITNCLLKGKTCPNVKRCTLRKKLKNISYLVNKEFKRITIASLL